MSTELRADVAYSVRELAPELLAVVVYPEWWWTCDGCGDSAPEPYDTRDEAARDADAHECKAKP